MNREANDTFLISNRIKTKEGKEVTFFYDWSRGIDEMLSNILGKYPNYFVLENETELWMKPTADNTITLEEMEDIASMDTVASLIFVDSNTKEYVAGDEEWMESVAECYEELDL